MDAFAKSKILAALARNSMRKLQLLTRTCVLLKVGLRGRMPLVKRLLGHCNGSALL